MPTSPPSCRHGLVFVFLLAALLTAPWGKAALAACCGQEALHAETFDNLSNWHPFRLPGAQKASHFTLKQGADGAELHVRSKDAGSGIVWNTVLDMHRVKRLCWRAMPLQPLLEADLERRGGDDSPLRLALLFSGDKSALDALSGAGQDTDRLLQSFMEHDSSSSMLAYSAVTDSASDHPQASPYSPQIKVVPWQVGETGKWSSHEAFPQADYKLAFGTAAPRWAKLALISDTDNTGGQATLHLQSLSLCPCRES